MNDIVENIIVGIPEPEAEPELFDQAAIHDAMDEIKDIEPLGEWIQCASEPLRYAWGHPGDVGFCVAFVDVRDTEGERAYFIALHDLGPSGEERWALCRQVRRCARPDDERAVETEARAMARMARL